MTWLPMDTWIVVVGALAAMSCAVLGTFLVLRKLSMMGDAISHAVLPGLAAGFLLTGSRDSLVMLVGAGVVGLLTALFTQWVHATGKVDRGAAMGVVFTILFAIGLILIRRGADHVDLDPDCVLYGSIELVPLDTVSLAGRLVPRAALITGAAFALNALCVALLYKEFKLTSFDPALATTLGINATAMHYLLMALVAITTVAAFESVGSILVIAMLIVPPATAHLLTDRLSRMLLLSVVLAALAAGLGHLGAITAPAWLGFDGLSTSTAGMMAVASGLLFTLALLLAPRHGLVSRAGQRLALAQRIAREDVLGLLYRLEEPGPRQAAGAPRALIARLIGAGALTVGLALRGLTRRGLIRAAGGVYHLTAAGRLAAGQVVRSHRLWEAYFERNLPLATDHLHPVAERLEHVTGAALRAKLADSLGHPERDPHGAPIPEGLREGERHG